MRITYRVIKPGVAVDGSGIKFYFSKNLDPAPGPNDFISADVFDQDRLTDVFIESGPNAGKERAEFESAGGPERDAPGWNPNRGTPDTGLNGGRPHNGRFSDDRYSPLLEKKK